MFIEMAILLMLVSILLILQLNFLIYPTNSWEEARVGCRIQVTGEGNQAQEVYADTRRQVF